MGEKDFTRANQKEGNHDSVYHFDPTLECEILISLLLKGQIFDVLLCRIGLKEIQILFKEENLNMNPGDQGLVNLRLSPVEIIVCKAVCLKKEGKIITLRFNNLSASEKEMIKFKMHELRETLERQ